MAGRSLEAAWLLARCRLGPWRSLRTGHPGRGHLLSLGCQSVIIHRKRKARLSGRTGPFPSRVRLAGVGSPQGALGELPHVPCSLEGLHRCPPAHPRLYVHSAGAPRVGLYLVRLSTGLFRRDGPWAVV